MFSRRSLIGGITCSLMRPWEAVALPIPKPVIFWFYGDEKSGVSDCPVSEPDFIVASTDLPCHGSNIDPNEPHELFGWRSRRDRGDDLFGTFNARCSSRLDKLISSGIADPLQVYAGGTSRGGFAALHLSLADSRFRSIIALSPVTDLADLSEFEGSKVDTMPLTAHSSDLASRRLFLSIGSRDDRVSTRSSIKLVEKILDERQNTDITFLLESGDGHIVTPRMKEASREWIVERWRHRS
jgi:predicted esterase